jgi:hypothetical protein
MVEDDSRLSPSEKMLREAQQAFEEAESAGNSDPAAVESDADGFADCPNCGKLIAADAATCMFCNQATGFAPVEVVEIVEVEVERPTGPSIDPNPQPIQQPRPQWAKPKPTPSGPADVQRGVIFAVGVAIAGAVAWALLLAYAGLQSWLVAIGIGWLVGQAAVRGAERMTDSLRTAVVLLTLGAVVVGQLLGFTLELNKETGILDFAFAMELYFDNLDTFGGDLLFALGGGGIGAWVAATQSNK